MKAGLTTYKMLLPLYDNEEGYWPFWMGAFSVKSRTLSSIFWIILFTNL